MTDTPPVCVGGRPVNGDVIDALRRRAEGLEVALASLRAVAAEMYSHLGAALLPTYTATDLARWRAAVHPGGKSDE